MRVAGLTLASFFVASAASASISVPPLVLGPGIATYDVYEKDLLGENGVGFPLPNSYVPGAFDVRKASANFATFADVNVADTPFSLNAAATIVSSPGVGPVAAGSIFASGNVTFAFGVAGPNPGQLVPVGLTAFVKASGAIDPVTGFDSNLLAGGIKALADLAIIDTAKPSDAPFSGPYYYDYSTGYTLNSVNMQIDTIVNLVEGDVYYVEQSVELRGSIYQTGSTISASASADPTFIISPSYLASHPDVQLQVSPGLEAMIPAGASVPEPSTWTLLLLGVGFGGANLRARRGRRAA